MRRRSLIHRSGSDERAPRANESGPASVSSPFEIASPSLPLQAGGVDLSDHSVS